MNGFIVIFCASREDVQDLSTTLLQFGILNSMYGERISHNRLGVFRCISHTLFEQAEHFYSEILIKTYFTEILIKTIFHFYLFIVTVHDDWTNKAFIQKNGSNRNILVCCDIDFKSFPVRTAQHIIHCSIPAHLSTFLRRYISIFATCEHIINQQFPFRGSVDENISIEQLPISSYLCLDLVTYQLSPNIFRFLSERKANFKEVIDVSMNYLLYQLLLI